MPAGRTSILSRDVAIVNGAAVSRSRRTLRTSWLLASDRIASTPKQVTIKDSLLFVDRLSPEQRLRLLQLVSKGAATPELSAYRARPVRDGEFSSDGEPLAWEAEGWADIG